MSQPANSHRRTNNGVAQIESAKRIGGRLCLDFVNTVHGRIRKPDRPRRDLADQVLGERLLSYEALTRWGVLAGAISSRNAQQLLRAAAERPGRAVAVLKRAVAIREALYRIFEAVIKRRTARPVDVATLNGELHRARSRQRLVAAPRFEFEWRTKPEALDRVLWPVVDSAVELLTGSGLHRVRQCPGEECGWLFLDTSRPGKRRWCDMADCGNLAKVRRFRRQHSRLARFGQVERVRSPGRHVAQRGLTAGG